MESNWYYFLLFIFIFIDANAYTNIILCLILRLDGADIGQQLGFDDHQNELAFSDDENIGGGK